jgi:DNA repair protein RAD7
LRQGAEQEPSVTAEQSQSPPVPKSPEDVIKKRKRQQAIARIKNSKEFARRKARDNYDDDSDDELAIQIHEEQNRPKPGQFANCEICDKRFTVTPYSKTGPNGGLLCNDCSKKQKADTKKPPAKKRATGIGRRQNQSNLLDGLTPHGTQSLLETCIKVCP